MSIKQQIDADLKAALLGGDKALALVLRGLKSSILNVEIAQNKRDEGLDDGTVIQILGKEAKSRQESADLYEQGGDNNRRDQELAEKAIIQGYLPQQLSDDELQALVAKAVETIGKDDPAAMGKIIGQVKAASAGQAEGARIAAAVKEALL